MTGLRSIPFLGEAEAVIELGIKSQLVMWDLAQVTPFWACCLSIFLNYFIYVFGFFLAVPEHAQVPRPGMEPKL